MSTGFELYKRWKTAKGFTSDNAARVRLGVTRAAISSWKNGHYSPSAATVELMAKELGEDPRGYVLKVESERASSPTFGKILAEVAKKFPPFAATLFLAIFGHEGNCKQLQVYTKQHFTYVTSYYPKACVHGTAQQAETTRAASVVRVRRGLPRASPFLPAQSTHVRGAARCRCAHRA